MRGEIDRLPTHIADLPPLAREEVIQNVGIDYAKAGLLTQLADLGGGGPPGGRSPGVVPEAFLEELIFENPGGGMGVMGEPPAGEDGPV